MNALVTLPSPDSFSAYLRAVHSIPMLSEAEENQLIHDWRVNQDTQAAQKLVLAHLRMVVKSVQDHANYGLNPGDLAQEGTVGLMKAVKRYDPQHQVRFAAYASKWINAEIRHFILNNWRMVRLGTSSAMKHLFFKYRKTISDIHKETPHVDEVELAKELKVSREDLRQAESFFRGRDEALTIPGPNPDEFYENPALLSLEREGAHQQNPADLTEQHLDGNLLQDRLYQGLYQLPERERDILVSRRLTDPPMGLGELAERHNLSLERVRQLENKAFSSLQSIVLDHLDSNQAPDQKLKLNLVKNKKKNRSSPKNG